jgi:predicted transposase YbfD/YdcC
VTPDAMSCQKTIASRILERGADYLLGLKANHGRQSVREVSPTASKIPQRRALG